MSSRAAIPVRCCSVIGFWPTAGRSRTAPNGSDVRGDVLTVAEAGALACFPSAGCRRAAEAVRRRARRCAGRT